MAAPVFLYAKRRHGGGKLGGMPGENGFAKASVDKRRQPGRNAERNKDTKTL